MHVLIIFTYRKCVTLQSHQTEYFIAQLNVHNKRIIYIPQLSFLLSQWQIKYKMSDIDQFFQNSYYNTTRTISGAIGLWPFHSAVRRNTIYLVMILVLGSGFTFQVNEKNILLYTPPFLFVSTNPLLFLYYSLLTRGK